MRQFGKAHYNLLTHYTCGLFIFAHCQIDVSKRPFSNLFFDLVSIHYSCLLSDMENSLTALREVCCINYHNKDLCGNDPSPQQKVCISLERCRDV